MWVYIWTDNWTPWANTLAYLKLEEDTNDSSWKWNNGTGTNITYTTLSTWKKVATFNGSSSKIDFSSPLFTSWPFTCSIWIYWNWLSAKWINIIMWNWPTDSSWYLSDRRNDTFRTIINNKWDSFTWYGNDKWILYTIAYDGNTSKSYKNGTYMETMDWTTVLNTSRNFYIWYRAYSNDRYWKWYFSDFICENKVRTAQEIANYYNSTKANYWL